MKLKSTFSLLTFAFMFIITTTASLEAKHHRHTTTYVEVVNHYPQQYVVHEYRPQPVYVAPAPVYVSQPVQTVVYQQPVVYQERTYVRERSCPGALITSFALGLGFGLLR